MPKISVIMSVYNTKEEWLRESIESILNQTFRDFEFIIINDGSTNNAEEVILSYKDDRIKYIKQENQGLAKSLNNGLDIACGEYVARMDSDDISLPQRFEKQVDYLDNNKGISVLGTWFEIFPETQIIKHDQNPKFLDILHHCCVGHPTVMFRRGDFEKYNLRYNPEYKCEDYELWSRAIRYFKFANIQEVLLKYRWHQGNLSKPTQEFLDSDARVRKNMVDFLTSDIETQEKIRDIISSSTDKKDKLTFLEKIFSVKNSDNKTHKIITILGIKFKIKTKKNKNIHIIKLMGGLGNQMFQYAFGKALEVKTGKRVIFDRFWFENAKKRIVNSKNENSKGVVIRKYDLDVFSPDITFATKKQIKSCRNKITEKNPFIYDEELFKKQGGIYEGYFQNEKYFKDIKELIKKEFKFPQISENDEFNQKWLNKIENCENPVFIHLRRGDYVNLGWNLSVDYYKKSIEYIKQYVKNPTFFVFGQDCEEYIKKEFNIDTPFEIIGEENSKNDEDWKDIMLMTKCKHAIIANSTFSWWAAWLGKANEGLVVVPTPFVNNQDEIICDNWIKIER